MGRGERFVVDYLRTRARERERWYVGLPLAALGVLGLAAMTFGATSFGAMIWAPRRPK